MSNETIISALNEIAAALDKCADDVPYELSAKENLYFRMVDMAGEARTLIRDMSV
jgi:hypothetical protein